MDRRRELSGSPHAEPSGSSQALPRPAQQYQKKSEKVVERNESLAQHLAETTEGHAKEAVRARH
jgi:hypothetical protein